jgi:hypothetical protein
MAGLIPQEKVEPSQQLLPPGAPGTEAAQVDPAVAGGDPNAGADPSGGAGAGAAGAPGDDSDDQGSGGLIPGQTAADPTADDTASDPTQQVADSGGANPDQAGMKGTVKDAQDAAVDDDPNAEVDATPEEQAQYDQLVARFVTFISDSSIHTPGQKSTSDTVLQEINNPKLPLAINLGQAVAHIIFMIVQSAKVHKVDYSPEVLFHAADECCSSIYLLANAAGIVKGMPPFKGLDAIDEDGDYDFEPIEIKVIGETKMQACRIFGNMLVKAGYIGKDVSAENQDFWKKQISREVAQGNVSDEVLAKLNKTGTFDKVHEHMGSDPSTMGEPQQPDPNQPPPDTAPTPPPADASTGDSGSAPPAGGDAGGGLIPPGAAGAPDPAQAGGNTTADAATPTGGQ